MYYCCGNDWQMEYLALKEIQIRILRISAFSQTGIIGGCMFF